MAAKNQNTVVSATQKVEPGAKKDALATALAQIEKQFGKGAVMKLGDNTAMQVDAISTGSLGLDMALGVGGVPRGRIIEVYGPESSGKTTLALHILAEAQKNAALLGQAAFRFNVKACDLPSKIDDMMANVKALEKQLEQLKSQMASRMGDTLLEKAIEVKGIKVLAARMDGADAKALRETMDKVKDKLGTAVAVLAAVSAEGRVQLAAGVSRDLTDRVKAGELVNSVAQKLGGKGGGKPDMAMAGAQSAEGLDAALADVQAWVEAKL